MALLPFLRTFIKDTSERHERQQESKLGQEPRPVGLKILPDFRQDFFLLFMVSNGTFDQQPAAPASNINQRHCMGRVMGP